MERRKQIEVSYLGWGLASVGERGGVDGESSNDEWKESLYEHGC